MTQQSVFLYQLADGTIYQVDHVAQTISLQNPDGTFKATLGGYQQFCNTLLAQLKQAYVASLVATNAMPEIQDMNNAPDPFLSAMSLPQVSLVV